MAQKESIKKPPGEAPPTETALIPSLSSPGKIANKGLSLINGAISRESLYEKGDGVRKLESLETG